MNGYPEARADLIAACATHLDNGLAPLVAAEIVTVVEAADLARRLRELLPAVELPRVHRAIAVITAPRPAGLRLEGGRS